MRTGMAATAVAVVFAALLCLGCGENVAGGPKPAASREGAAGVPERVRRNQIVLTAKQSRALLAWSRRFRGCLASRGIHTSVHVTRREISMAVTPAAPKRKLLRLVPTCAERFGGPPRRASLQVFESLLVLYLPKQCLLDAKVAATRHAAANDESARAVAVVADRRRRSEARPAPRRRPRSG
jgi:hypothetical protein